jgi:hypothetical protein
MSRISRTRDEVLADLLEQGAIESLDQKTSTRYCGRCGGSGHYAWCHDYGTRCFECGGDPRRSTWQEPIDKRIKREQAADRREAKKAREAAAINERAENPSDERIARLAEYASEDNFAADLVSNWAKYGDLSEKQWAWVEKLPAKIEARRAERAERDAAKASRKHVGEIGERVTVDATVAARISLGVDGYGNYRTLYKFEDTDGNLLVWFTSALVEGDEVTLTGTVKKHDEFDGEAQTILSRCRIN